MDNLKTALTIAGSDSSGGAGIQADLKTMTSLGVFGMSAITSLTAQNTTGVSGLFPVDAEFIRKQIDAVFQDIPPDAIKIGMLYSSELIIEIANKLKEYKAKNVVLDPVMVATSGAKLLQDDAIETLKNDLFPLVDVITPNIPESEIISNMEIVDEKGMEIAAKEIFDKYNVKVLLKGGHSINDANDLLYDGNEMIWFKGNKIDNENTHGTGCTLSSAIASYIAKGLELKDAIKSAKEYISGALNANLNLGKGSGPLNHMWNLKEIK